jgi:hypothetical protein
VTQEAIRFGYPMRAWQRACAGMQARFVVLVLHRRAGKTELALKRLLNAAVKCRLDLPLYIYVAPFLKQAKLIAWSRLKQMVAPLVSRGMVEVSEVELFVRFVHNGATIRIFGADNPDAMRGVRLDGAVIDETAQIKIEVWEEIIQPALSDRLGWAWFLGTPKGINLFSQLYFAAQALEGWASALYTVADTDALDPTEVERLRQSMSPAAFAREYLCDFAAAGDDQLISLTDADVASRRIYTAAQVSYAPVILGVDPARFGDDRSVIIRRQGLQAFSPIALTKIDNMQLAARVAEQIEQRRPDAVFIDSGAGAGVIDRLRQLNFEVVEVNFGGSPSSAKYLNKRAEMWDLMAEWLGAGGAIPNETGLKIELATPTYKFDAANRKVLESKDDIKKRLAGGASPDMADALALTFAHPVVKRADVDRARQSDRRDYDPLARLNKR